MLLVMFMESLAADLKTTAKDWQLSETLPLQALSEVGVYGGFRDNSRTKNFLMTN